MMRVGRLAKRRRLAPATVWGLGLTGLAQAEVVSELVVRWDHSCQAAPVRGQSNHVLSEVLRAGRASTAGLSPLSTPDSILMCYQK